MTLKEIYQAIASLERQAKNYMTRRDQKHIDKKIAELKSKIKNPRLKSKFQ